MPVYECPAEGGPVLRVGPLPERSSHDKPQPLCFALCAETKQPPAQAVPLYEFVHRDGTERVYSTDGSLSGYRRVERPICLVWRDPAVADRSQHSDTETDN